MHHLFSIFILWLFFHPARHRRCRAQNWPEIRLVELYIYYSLNSESICVCLFISLPQVCALMGLEPDQLLLSLHTWLQRKRMAHTAEYILIIIMTKWPWIKQNSNTPHVYCSESTNQRCNIAHTQHHSRHTMPCISHISTSASKPIEYSHSPNEPAVKWSQNKKSHSKHQQQQKMPSGGGVQIAIAECAVSYTVQKPKWITWKWKCQTFNVSIVCTKLFHILVWRECNSECHSKLL